MTSKEFIETLKKAAESKTLYVSGGFGAPLNEKNKKRYSTNNDYNRAHADQILKASSDTFAFDCCNAIKGVLWGWSADVSATYGGAEFCSNGIPDVGENTMIEMCTDLSTDFSNIKEGEAVWIPGHIGVYIGNNLVIEATPAWKNGVQITALANKGGVVGYNSRAWTKHGKLPWIEYVKAKNGWVHDGNGWLYYEDDEIVKNAWRRDSIDLCYLGWDGYMVRNMWMADDGGWHFCGDDGHIVRNAWVRDNIGLRYYGEDGYPKVNATVKIETDAWGYAKNI